MSNIYDEYEPYYSNDTTPKCGTKSFIINKETREVINADEIFAYGILMKRKYSKDFIKKGTIKFGCPKMWIDYAATHKPGKGDMQEGVFAAYDLKNIEGIKSGLKDNPGSFFIRLISSRSDQVYLVDRKVISLPTYCFYIIKTGDYEIVRYGGSEYTAHLHIPPRYIRGLADEKSWEEAMKDNPSEQYVFVFIYGHKLFEKKIFDKLSELGVAKNEMLHGPIQYKNMDKPFQKEVDHPLELFFKNEQFYDQHEGRIVINTDNCALKQFLLDNTIDIGPLEDICVLFDHYPAGGIESFIDLDV